MFQLLQPIWLWASAAIIIPVAIHLWNIKQSKTLKVGSIIFLEERAKKQSKSLRISEWLLLCLRCLLIILFALLLAKPQWQQTLQSNKQKGWILLDDENINETYSHFKPSIDSLLNAGYEFHYFKEGFAKKNFQDALQKKTDTNNISISYLILANQLQQQLHSPAFIFTSNQLIKFNGNASPLNNIHWQTYTPKDSLAQWIEEVYLTNDDSVKIIIANSSPLKTIYQSETIAFKDGINKVYSINKSNSSISYNHQTKQIDTATLKIGIYADEIFAKDAEYVKAAIEAIQKFSKRKIKLFLVKQQTTDKLDWVFWLSEKNIPATLITANAFIYAKGKPEKAHSAIAENEARIRIHKFIPSTKVNNQEAIWQDGSGNNLLIKENNSYTFYSRFDPSWNDLVWSNSFAEITYQLLYNRNNQINKLDKRIISNNQLQSFIAPTKDQVSTKTTTDISIIFWLSAFTVLLIERWLSSKNKKQA